MNKEQYVEKYLHKLKNIASNAIKVEKFEKALSAISVAANIMYGYNQSYTDDLLENFLLELGKQIITIDKENYIRECNKRVVLFYDSFGLNTRGVALVYTKAIALAGYKLIYVTNNKCGRLQPDLMIELSDYDVECLYIDTNTSYINWINELLYIFKKYKPASAFFYTKPSDSAGTVVFNELCGCVKRYFLDLTDHAFWLGKNAADYFIGGRDVSASIAYYYRGISREKLIMLDANLYINKNAYDGELPFDINIKRYIFSGGALYKTLGDPDHKFYQIIDALLLKNKDLLFLYAGVGDDSQIKLLQQKFIGRVFLVGERTDFYRLIEHCTIYINTYPMFGGLMMRYAANAGKLPITLKHGNDSDGILINQKQLNIEYEDMSELIMDTNKLLEDEEYLHQREKKLIGSVMTEECFVRNIKSLIENTKTEFIYKLEKIDTSCFREEFLKRFKPAEYVGVTITKKINKSIFINFPILFLVNLPILFFKKILKRIKKMIIKLYKEIK